ncbi:MAG: Coenzyme F420 hydrogenase/dehydrogenase, beta subunit C-terminal domain [Bacilli bacterium]|nr:Coenzyme F420 hydrogenase/dehydrogenase, beta subunit C-terminal domain [Bacilli bacterium]MDD4733537.1 Coenzyme F420 hydrogenase/dehydrogenase, beta subunit C-terminal domain [Bacilli bacterium]
MILQFKDKKNCCGCAACINICPTKAISMETDNYGFIYPKINHDICIECGKCKKVCAYQNVPISGKKPLATYVAINKDNDILLSSTSGGIFGALSSVVFDKKGVVFGCAYNGNMEPVHICIDNPLDMKKLQGSKYVQSNINFSFKETEKYLKKSRFVLFTGAPCQIAALKSYLGKDYDNLITADIICHGVPSIAFFNDYIKHIEKKTDGKVININFRDKSRGWGLKGTITYTKRGKIKTKYILPFESYYYNYFLKGYTYRENCYECKYACESREGDFTMGDFWGIESIHPEIETKRGVSILLVNSKKGVILIEQLKKYLNLTKSTFEAARRENGQLNRPTIKSKKREEILDAWQTYGYETVARNYYKENKLFINKIKFVISKTIKK